MASFIVYGDASGQVTVAAPAVAGSNTITFPAETGTLVTTAYTGVALPGQINWNTTVQTTGFTAVAYGGYFCNTTSSAFTVTLPATPTRGQFVVIVDYAGTAGTNNILIGANGNNINGITGNASISTNRQGLSLTYIDSTQGWLATSNVYATSFNEPYTATYLVIAGGGGAGTGHGGGGGAGGFLTGTTTLSKGTVYTVTVGGGGPSSPGAGNPASNISGSNSVFSSVTATGGGGGGDLNRSGANGGSGGGASGYPSSTLTGGSGTPGQGNNGGSSVNNYSGCGGGGASSAGKTSNSTRPDGGNGTASSITGTPAIYAGGGGGGVYQNSTPGGLGGPGTPGVSGGNGSSETPAGAGTAGVTNTGGGGGGGSYNGGVGGAGGSGRVVISVPTSSYPGVKTGTSTTTTNGSNTVITWTGSGTYTA